MRALFLIPGDGVSQLQALPAVASTARQLGFQIQVVCPAAVTGVWTLLKEVEKTIPFSFEQATLAARLDRWQSRDRDLFRLAFLDNEQTAGTFAHQHSSVRQESKAPGVLEVIGDFDDA